MLFGGIFSPSFTIMMWTWGNGVGGRIAVVVSVSLYIDGFASVFWGTVVELFIFLIVLVLPINHPGLVKQIPQKGNRGKQGEQTPPHSCKKEKKEFVRK